MKKAVVFYFFLIFLCVSCTRTQQYYEESGNVFHTIYNIKYQSSEILTDRIDAELQAFSLSMNPFNPNSTIAKINRNEEAEADALFMTVFNKAMEVSALSGGAFDVTSAPLINRWGFGFENHDSISPKIIDSLKQTVGYEKVHLKNKRIIKNDPRVKLNFSAIAKGYASDVIANMLEREGVQNYMVWIGGEVVTKGNNPNGECWRVGINKPEDDKTGLKNEIEEIIQLCGKKGLATSGNYRNFYIKDGKKYAHTIDPRTGYPAAQNILSATVIASDCMTADAYATTFMVVGIDAACEMAKKIPGIEYYLICTDEETGQYKKICSDGIKAMLK